VVNVAGALGIFAKYDPEAGWFEDPSTVLLSILRKLQDLIDKLRSPKWPEAILGKLDAGKVAKGKALFDSKCRGCHAEQRRDLPLERVRVTMVPAVEIQTDRTMAENANRRKLQDANGENEQRVGTAVAGATFDIILSWSHPGQILAFVGEALSAALLPKRDLIPSGPPEAYKARPLEGIWATAPYLHNGSVPNLYELLLPEEKRTKQFCVGTREFDPMHVGFVMMTDAECKAKNLHWLDTSMAGNRNTGHAGPGFGVKSEEEIWALVEYMKSL
jgi:mono/diheme cytochrome c family protein